MIDKKMWKINWERPAKEIEQLIRGLNPWPSAYTFMKGKSLKLWTASVVYEEREAVPGEIVEIGKEGILVKTGEGLLLIRELQLEGKKRMDTAAFLRGYTVDKGWILGE